MQWGQSDLVDPAAADSQNSFTGFQEHLVDSSKENSKTQSSIPICRGRVLGRVVESVLQMVLRSVLRCLAMGFRGMSLEAFLEGF